MSIAIAELIAGRVLGSIAVMLYTYPMMKDASASILSAKESLEDANKLMVDQRNLLVGQRALIDRQNKTIRELMGVRT